MTYENSKTPDELLGDVVGLAGRWDEELLARDTALERMIAYFGEHSPIVDLAIGRQVQRREDIADILGVLHLNNFRNDELSPNDITG